MANDVSQLNEAEPTPNPQLVGSDSPTQISSSANVDSVVTPVPQTAGGSGGTQAAAGASTVSDGALIGPYRIVRKLGQGGMGAVYEAMQTKLEKTVALKVLPTEVTQSATALSRFEREMKAVGKLDHPNIVRAMDADEHNGMHYLVMEFVDGIDLTKLIARHGQLPIGTACELIRQAAAGLEHAHAMNLVHRDIKPSNLLLSTTGQLKILDLGLARLHGDANSGEVPSLTSYGQILGTPDYMAPEQWDSSHEIDGRADLYALGCTLFFLLVGRPPYGDSEHKSLSKKMAGHTLELAPDLRRARADVPEELVAIYRRMMAKQAAKRFANTGELAAALQQFLQKFPACAEDILPTRLMQLVQAEITPAVSDEASNPHAPTIIKNADSDELDFTQKLAIESLVDDFEQQWQSGERRSLADVIPTSGPLRKGLLASLIPVAMELHRQADVRPPFEQWLDTFPELATEHAWFASVPKPWRDEVEDLLNPSTIHSLPIPNQDKSDLSVTAALTSPKTQPLETQAKPTRTNRSRMWIGMSVLGVLLLLGVIIIKIKKPDGTVTEVKVPEGTEVDLSGLPKGSKVEILPDAGAKMPQVTKGNIPDAPKPDAPKVAMGFDPAAERKGAEWVVKFGDCTLYDEKDQFLAQPNTGAPTLPQGPFYVREVLLSGVDNAGLKALAGCRRLQSVRFGANCGKISAAGLQALSECRALKKLELEGTSVGAGSGDLLKSWAQLEWLNLHGAPIDDDVLAGFPDCPKLKVLGLGSATPITDAGLKQLVTHCPHLERLDLYQSGDGLQRTTLVPLTPLKKLQHLSLMGDQVTDEGIKVLDSLPMLDSIVLASPGVNQATARLLSIESKFRSVVLERYTPTLQLTDADFRQLSKYRGLREVQLNGELRVTDAVLLELAEMTDLKKLILYGVQVPHGGAAPYSAEGIAKFRERRPDVDLKVDQTLYPPSSSIPFAVLQQLDQTDPLPAWELPAGAPQPVVVPCSVEDAIARQKAWAEFLKRPVIEELDLARMARAAQREGEAPAEPRGGKKGDQPKDGSAGASPSQTLKFALIPPGEIRKMFTRDFQGEYEPGTPVRRLRVNKPFAISTTEVTWDQFRQFVEATGYQTEAELNGVGGRDRDGGKPDPQGKITWRNPGWKVDPQEPVTQVTSRDAAAFCDWLTKSARSDRIHAVDGKSTPNGQQADVVKRPDKSGHYELYRLPTEAEWHHACRAGSSHKYVVSPDAKDLAEYAWSKESLDPDPQANPLHRVGTKKPNPFGLHDMQGNVWEHVSESYLLAQTPYLRGHDLIGAPVGGVSGGSWVDPHTLLTPTEPLSGWSTASSNIGFRVVRQLDDAPQPGWLERPLVLNPGQSLSRLALVPRPEPIPGLRSWSVELAGTHPGRMGFTAIASSPNGDLVATGNEYGKISLWDREGKYRGALLGHDGWVLSLHFSPDGRWLASCDDVFGLRGVLGHSVRIWDVESRTLRTVIPITPMGSSKPFEVAFSPDSSQLAVTKYTGGNSGGLFLVDVASGRIQQSSLAGFEHNIGIAWSPDGTKLASVSDRLRIWDNRTLKLLQEGDLTPFRPLGHKVSWSPDGKWLATTHEGGKLAIRDATTLKVERTIGNNAVDFQWLPDSQRVALAVWGSDGEIFNALTGELTTKIPASTATLTLLDNGRELAIPAYAGLHIYDTTTGKLLRESPRVGAMYGNDALHAVSPKGDELMSFGLYCRTMRVTDTATGREKRTIPLAVPSVAPFLSPNGALFAGINENRSTGLILDATTGAFVADLPHGDAKMSSWTWSPDSQRLATGTTDKQVRLWNIAETKVEHELAGHTKTVAHLAWSPDGTRLASAAEDQTVRLWDARTGKLIASYDKFPEATQFGGISYNAPRQLAWSRDGRQLWIALTNHIVPLDPETGAFGPMENASNGNGVTFLNPSPDGQRLLVRAAEDWTFVRDHQAPTPRLLGQYLGLTAEWHPDSRRFLGWDRAYGSVGFDVETNRRLGTHFPWLVDKHWLTIGPTGHYVGSPGIEAHIVYVAQHDDGSQRTYTPTEFAEKFNWKNDPEKAELLGK